MKKTLCLLLAALMLLLAGCAPSHQEVMDSIPTLMVLAGNAPAQVPTCGYDWTVTNRLGRGASIIADAVHPLDAQADLPTVALSGGETASLYFSLVPDSVTVTYWGAQETDHENSAQVETAYLHGNVVGGLANGSGIVNVADVGGVYNGQWIQAVSRWVTKVYAKTITILPKTGY